MKMMIRNLLGLSLALSGSLRTFCPIRVRSVALSFHSIHSVSVSLSTIDASRPSLICISGFTARPLQLSGPHYSRRGIPIRFDLTSSGDHLY